MNSIQYHIKQNGMWQKLNATPVFPFSIGELLDERLDEAYLTIYDSPTEHYARLTDVRATIYNGTNEPKAEYFIIASDTSVELPAGSGKYKHELYLIERTKLLEGIYCSSLTFTNALPRDYSVVLSRVSPENMNNMQPLPVGFYGYPSITSPRLNTTDYIVPTPRDVGTYLAEIYNEEETGSITYTPYSTRYQAYSSVTIYLDNEYLSESTENAYIITADLLSKSKNLTLVYVIYVSRIILGEETQYAFTFKFDIGLYSNILPLKRWTITDCITRACELALPLFGTEKPQYRLDGVEYGDDGNVTKPYTVGSLAEKYDKVFAPEFTLTQDTLREQLRTILSFVHAEPWLDENDVIRVEEYGNTTVSASEGLPYVYSSGRSHINEYCTEIRSHAQNLASSLGYAKGTMIDPGDGLYRSLRTETAYARINEDNGIAKTAKPIYSIDKVMCGIANSNGTWWLDPVEITPYVFEATEYGANLSPYKGGFPYSRAYAIYYTMGQPNLYGLFYQAPDKLNNATYSPYSIANILSAVTGENVDDIYNRLKNTTGGAADLVFSITYKPISNHFISHGKSLYVEGETPFMQLYNQTENLVESQYYGEHIKGVAARLGNVEEERTFILKDIDDIPHVGQMLDEYAISAVSTEIYPFDIKCTVGLSKDFNRISEYVGINSAKRMYEISERQSTQRDILYKETLVIGTKPTGYSSDSKLFDDLTPFLSLFDSNETNEGAWRITSAALTTFKKNRSTQIAVVRLPVIGRSLGNVITFNFSTKDNYSAGDSTAFISGNSDVNGRWQTDVPYTDYYGRAWWSTINLAARFNRTDSEVIRDAYNLPLTAVFDTKATLANLRLRKDNRETLSYNLELEIKTTDPNLIIGSALAELSGWVNDTDVSPELYFFDAEKYSVSKFDKQYTPHSDDIRGYDYGSSAFPGNPFWSITNEADGTLNFRTVGQRINGHGVGFVLCTPIETVTETVENEDGEIEEITYQTGGDILLANNGPFAFGETISYDFYVTKN